MNNLAIAYQLEHAFPFLPRIHLKFNSGLLGQWGMQFSFRFYLPVLAREAAPQYQNRVCSESPNSWGNPVSSLYIQVD